MLQFKFQKIVVSVMFHELLHFFVAKLSNYFGEGNSSSNDKKDGVY